MLGLFSEKYYIGGTCMEKKLIWWILTCQTGAKTVTWWNGCLNCSSNKQNTMQSKSEQNSLFQTEKLVCSSSERTSRGQCYLIRYCDDFVVCFQYENEAKIFYEKLQERFKKYGLDQKRQRYWSMGGLWEKTGKDLGKGNRRPLIFWDSRFTVEQMGKEISFTVK